MVRLPLFWQTFFFQSITMKLYMIHDFPCLTYERSHRPETGVEQQKQQQCCAKQISTLNLAPVYARVVAAENFLPRHSPDSRSGMMMMMMIMIWIDWVVMSVRYNLCVFLVSYFSFFQRPSCCNIGASPIMSHWITCTLGVGEISLSKNGSG